MIVHHGNKFCSSNMLRKSIGIIQKYVIFKNENFVGNPTKIFPLRNQNKISYLQNLILDPFKSVCKFINLKTLYLIQL